MQPERERRRDPRWTAALPVELPWGAAVTRDLSVSGAFIETAREVPIGSEIAFTIGLGADPGELLPLQCQGRVVRRGGEGEQGIGVRINAFWLEQVGNSGLLSVNRNADPNRERQVRGGKSWRN